MQFVSGPFPSPPYYKGHFSNGRVWIELVAAQFGDELENFATGNAVSGAVNVSAGQFMVQPPYANMSSAKEVFVPSALDQVGFQKLANQMSTTQLEHAALLSHCMYIYAACIFGHLVHQYAQSSVKLWYKYSSICLPVNSILRLQVMQIVWSSGFACAYRLCMWYCRVPTN